MHARHPSPVSKRKPFKPCILEFLEPRRLLTTFHGGDTFEFLDAQGNIERLKFFGNITAEVIGGAVQLDNTLKLVNLPGTLNGAPINGGIGGGSGSQLIGNSSVNGTATAVSALAADATGNVYYVTETPTTVAGPTGNVTQNIVQISMVDPTTGNSVVVAEVSAQAVAAAGGRFAGTNPMVTGISGAAFSPVDGKLYFVATGGTNNTPVLFSVDVTQQSSAAIGATLTAATGSFGSAPGTAAKVGAIAFDSTGTNSATLVAAINTGKSPMIVTIDPTDTDNLGTSITPTVAGKDITAPITGLAFYPNTSANNNVTALTNSTTKSQVLSVNLPTGAATILGNLPANGQKQGQNPGDLTYDAALTDPFTGQQGALLGTDTGTKTFFYVDPAIRSGTDSIFTIYVSQSDFTGGISIAEVPPLDVTPRPMEPFADTIGELRVTNAQTGLLNAVGAPGGTGEAFIGARTIQIGTVPNNDEPILTGQVTAPFGVLPANITTLHAGLIVAGGQNLGNFLLGGTLTGEVNIGGAINQFYAGWLLTGDASGEGVNEVTDPQNFKVAGNIGKLTVLGGIGSDNDGGVATTLPTYDTGFDMYVGGTIGAVQSFQSILGAINAANLTGVPENGADQTETEIRGGSFDNDELAGNADFNNDTYATAQYLSNGYNAAAGTDDSIIVDGVVQDDTVNNDKVDYYAVSLLAGQTITVQVASTGATTTAANTTSAVQTGVFDPDGREIASDYNRPDDAATAGQPFQFTTDRPGVYRFAVAPSGDSTFAGTSGVLGDLPYTLSIKNVGHMAIGAVVASNDICDNTTGTVAGIGALSDDIGAIVAGKAFVSATGNTIAVENGSLRSITAATMGTGTAGTDPEITVPNGNVGLVETTSGDMYFNAGLMTPAIGGDYELVSSAGNFAGDIIANGNIGTVRVQNMSDARGAAFSADDNHASDDGSINLIDDAGDLGSAAVGGPSIKVGPNGSLKYLHVLGTVFRNSLFGQTMAVSGSGQTITYDPGESVPFVEASGATVTLIPVVTTAVPAPALTITTYGLDEGGSAIVSVVSTGGLTVQATGDVTNQAIGIGSIDLQGEGNTVTAGTSMLTQHFAGLNTVEINSPPTLPITVSPLSLVFSGTSQVSAFDVMGGSFDQIANNTPGGEIVNVTAGSIGSLNGGGAIGSNISHNTAAALLPNKVVLNAFPFNGQRTGVVVSGSIVNVNLASVGNISAGGDIGTINGTIKAPVFATGQINNVLIGGGIYPSGSGAMSNAGIYANGVIGNVVGTNADIRGNIASNTGIQSVNLQNGSIINANIDEIETLSNTENIFQSGVIATGTGGTVTHPVLAIGSIVTNGTGGIIGSFIESTGLGVLSARNGFGILNTTISATINDDLGSIYADGYGIRQVLWEGGYNAKSITANGNGSLESTAVFSDQVRYSERVQFDPLFGFEPNAATDIDSFLGASATNPVIPGVTDTGVIEDSTFRGGHQLGNVRAWSIRSATPNVAGGVTTFNFSNAIGSIVTTGPVNGLNIITGKLGTFSTGGDLMHTTLTIAGRINNFTVHANITDSSSIIAHGKNGNIGKLTVFGNVDGLIEADGGRITNVTVHGSLTGKVQTKFIQNLTLYQNLGSGSLEITGSAGTLRFIQDLGPAGNTLTVDGNVSTLRVGSNLTGNINVLGNLGKLQVGGAIVTGSKTTVGKVLQLLQVGSDFQAGAIVQAHAVKKIKVRGVNAGSIVIV